MLLLAKILFGSSGSLCLRPCPSVGPVSLDNDGSGLADALLGNVIMLSEGRAGVDNVFTLRTGMLHRRSCFVESDTADFHRSFFQ